MNKKALVLLSGGQDSTTCLAIAKRDADEVIALCVDYGQRHRIELEQAKRIANLANVPYQLVSLDILSQLNPNALVCSDMDIRANEDELPNTFVPGRNALFLNVAAMAAYQHQISDIYIGVCETDFSGYPDCRSDFIESMQQSLSLAMEYDFNLLTPLMDLDKSETVLLMKDLGRLEWLKESHTCYEGMRPACGVCPACQLRLKGFEKANIKDPLEYVIQTS